RDRLTQADTRASQPDVDRSHQHPHHRNPPTSRHQHALTLSALPPTHHDQNCATSSAEKSSRHFSPRAARHSPPPHNQHAHRPLAQRQTHHRTTHQTRARPDSTSRSRVVPLPLSKQLRRRPTDHRVLLPAHSQHDRVANAYS